MPSFDDRENAFENKFAHDAEMQFKAESRRNKLAGLWAAGLLDKSEEDAAIYAKDVIKAFFGDAGAEGVYRKLFEDVGHLADEGTIRGKMSELLTVARAQLLSES